jgi:hypothetical protein
VIVYETVDSPGARAGEAIVAGRRLAGRLLPYGGEGAGRDARFDPVERRFATRRAEPVIAAGPFRPDAWIATLERFAAGPVLVGPDAPAESVRGSYRAAAGAAVTSGRPVYLLDPEPEGIPDGADGAAVVLCMWRPGRPETAFAGLETARDAGLEAAALFPFLPGWTDEPETVERLAVAARGGGAVSLTPIAPALDGEGRRAIVEARSSLDPSAGEAFFEIVHHGGWDERLGGRMAAARAAIERSGLRTTPPRPRGRGERAGNAAASERLEELADERESDEPRAALLYAAVRWIDGAGRDLAAVAREGNFRRIFPFGTEIAEAAEAALRGDP